MEDVCGGCFVVVGWLMGLLCAAFPQKLMKIRLQTLSDYDYLSEISELYYKGKLSEAKELIDFVYEECDGVKKLTNGGLLCFAHPRAVPCLLNGATFSCSRTCAAFSWSRVRAKNSSALLLCFLCVKNKNDSLPQLRGRRELA